MYYEVIFNFDDEDKDPRYSIRPQVTEDAPQDNTVALISPMVAEQNGIELNTHGFPTLASLEAWHRKHNPQLFTE